MKSVLLALLYFQLASMSPAMAMSDRDAPWLDVTISGRGCPKLAEVRVEKAGIRLLLDEDFQLRARAGGRVQRAFCQLTIQAVHGKPGRQALILEGLKFTGINREAKMEDLRIDLNLYRQGEKDHWQHQESVALEKDKDWHFAKDISQPLELGCEDSRSLQLKLAISTRKGPAKTILEPEFSLSREWFLQTSWKNCS